MPWERGHSVDIGKPIQVTGNAIDHGQLTRAIDAVGTYIIIMWPPRNLECASSEPRLRFSTRMTLRRNDCRCNRCGTATTPDSASTSWARLGVDAHHTKVDLGARGEPGPRRRRRPTDPDERLCRASSQTTTIRGVQSAAIGGGDGDRLPVPRRSCHPEEIRQNQAAERRQPVEVTGDDGLVHSRAIGTAAVGTKSRSGPPPTIGTRGVVLVQIADVVARRAVHSGTAGKQSRLKIDRNRRGPQGTGGSNRPCDS